MPCWGGREGLAGLCRARVFGDLCVWDGQEGPHVGRGGRVKGCIPLARGLIARNVGCALLLGWDKSSTAPPHPPLLLSPQLCPSPHAPPANGGMRGAQLRPWDPCGAVGD